MADWSERWPEERARWGTFSVVSHADLRKLILYALTFDVLVFPTPTSNDDFDRWDRMGWEPELSAKRITQLGDAAVTVPWDSEMRHRWRE